MDSPSGPSTEGALDGLLAVLDLVPLAADRFRAACEGGRLFDRIYGGQLLAQAIVGAGRTAPDRDVSSVHATFVEAGDPARDVVVAVQRVRDGRSLVTREVTVMQGDRTLLVALVSLHSTGTDPDVGLPMPAVPSPGDLPAVQHWAAEHGRHWIEHPPPVELRIGEPLTFLGGAAGEGPRSHWMRVPRDVGDDPVLHAALLAYGSDFFLMDVVFRMHPHGAGVGRFGGFSLDHAIWFHRRPRFDEWHVHTQEGLAVVGDRGLAQGRIHDRGGRHVATVMQEIVVRRLAAS